MLSMMPYWEVHDKGRGPWMLMVHGFLSSRAQWRANLDALTQFSRPVLVELLGHGRSPSPEAREPYEIASYMRAFEAIRRELGAERWVVCGQSFGAGLAIQYALEHPDRTMGLVFTNSNSALSVPNDPERTAAQDERARAIMAGGRAALWDLRIHPRNAKRFPEAIKSELLADAEMIEPDGILRSIAWTSPDLSLAHRLGDIAVPTLFVNGIWEKRFQPLRDRIAAGIPGVVVKDFPGGHSINIEAAEGFEQSVREFVEGLPHG
jgi:2-succinyl-6-hydroxy-2,4-cyclohexadiene-1-carboxylate synthase